MTYLNLVQLLDDRAQQQPDSIAIEALNRDSLTYRDLHRHVISIAAALNQSGIGRNDRVAIVMPNGPEMATAFLAVAAGATSAPLNPQYRAAEFDFYLSDLGAKALIIQADLDSEARLVARDRGIPIIDLVPQVDRAAGLFELRQSDRNPIGPGDFAAADDVALVLHTSGTTSRPKIVPLTQPNICASAQHIRAALQLTIADRCLNVMPLFHIHGLIAAVLASLAAGGSVVCTPGFYSPSFFEWIDRFHPTWFTAVPTMHQAILARAADQQSVIRRSALRFIRSSSASLAPQVMSELERTFNVPVIEAYGMTEAAHQMTSNPLPPRPRKAGSVGVAAGPEVAIMAEEGSELMPIDQRGEIVIRGANVMCGYANNPSANEQAFTQGWFRTGDQGYLDSDGYLCITGRLKEIINRGGEKISPREIDEVLLDHPAIAQAITFAMPDAKFNEEVAAAVVLRENRSATEIEIRLFAEQRLANYKVPKRVIILKEIPKGPTGKIQRIGLAEKLGLNAEDQSLHRESEFAAPRTPLEESLAAIWQEMLQLPKVGVRDEFLRLGGDSILAVQLIARVKQKYQLVTLSLVEFFSAPTIADQAVILARLLLEEIEALNEDELPSVIK